LEFGTCGLGGFHRGEAPAYGTSCASNIVVHSTFLQKVIICAVLGFLAAALVEWGKVFVEGADDALNAGYKHRTSDTSKP
jgi:hypothetical protein